MVRLADVDELERAHLEAKVCEPLGPLAWAEGPPLRERRVALVTTAGLHRRSDSAFSMLDLSYRVIPGDVDLGELSMSHSSVHFDRSGFREDTNLVFPLDRLRELQAKGVVGTLAKFHYSLMGAGWPPDAIESTARELARLLREDGVDAVCLVPV